MKEQATKDLEGKAPSGILIQLSDRLIAIGEERFPVVSYLTDEKVDMDGDS